MFLKEYVPIRSIIDELHNFKIFGVITFVFFKIFFALTAEYYVTFINGTYP